MLLFILTSGIYVRAGFRHFLQTLVHQLRLSLFSGIDSKPTSPVLSLVLALTDALVV